MTDNAQTIISAMINIINPMQARRFYNGQTQASIRCPFCGDSNKAGSSHLYILLSADPVSGIPLFPFDCKKCDCDGEFRGSVFSSDILMDHMNLVDDDTLYDYLKIVRKDNLISKSAGMRKQLGVARATNVFRQKKLNLPVIDNARNRMKLAYVNARIPYIKTLEDLSKLNIVPSIGDVYQMNKFLEYNKNDKYMKAKLNRIHADYLGFLSADNGKISCRDITDTHKLRYENVSLYENDPDSSNTFFIPTSINILSEWITIVIAEGQFDVIRIYFDIYECREEDVMYASANNNHGFLKIIKRAISMGFVNFNVDIYSDQDVAFEEYAHIRKICPSHTNFRVNYNKLSKDFGRMTDPIQIASFSMTENRALNILKTKYIKHKLKGKNTKVTNRRRFSI